MFRLLCVLLASFPLGPPVFAQEPTLREADRVRVAEAFRLAADVGDSVWAAWSTAPFAILLVTPRHEFLIRHSHPSADFHAVAYDSLLQSEIYVRDRAFAPNLLATFPAVGAVPTVVVGQPEQTGKSSTFWVLTVLHEHFHQLQYSQPGYYDAAAGLDLSGDDQTGQWMLDYPFPYRSKNVGQAFAEYKDALRRSLEAAGGAEMPDRVRAYAGARDRLRTALSEKDRRYMSFQLWQEGVARYTEYRVAEMAALRHRPSPNFQALADFVPYAVAAESLRHALSDELSDLDLTSSKRVAFYPTGAAEAILLDVLQPGWRRRYFTDMFCLECYFPSP